jgi:UDP:flavonoid glycosyltransferase YjiC (YdhE family)
MRVYFAPCGIGLGHVGRCIPIARRLLKDKASVAFSTYREGIEYIKQEKLPLIQAPPIGFQVQPDGTIDFRQTVVNPGPLLSSFTLLDQVNSEIRTIKSFNSDIVVADTRISPLIAARLLRIPIVCILNQFQPIIPRKTRFLHLARLADAGTLTLIGKLWTSGNIVLIPDFPKPYTICSGNLTIPQSYKKKVKLIGPVLPKRPDDLASKEDIRKKLSLPADRAVIFAPISGPTMERAFLIKILGKILTDFSKDYEVVMSLASPNSETQPTRHGNVTIFNWLPNRFEYLKACDLVIGRAGHGTITQSMCYGKPMILIPTPSHTEQISNAKQAKDLGTAIVIQQEEVSREKLLTKADQILKSDMPERLENVKKEVLRYDGLENAYKTIVEMAETQTSILG